MEISLAAILKTLNSDQTQDTQTLRHLGIVQEFASHCAPEPPKGPAQMTIAQLREQLQTLGLTTPKGARKGSLVEQLQVAFCRSP